MRVWICTRDCLLDAILLSCRRGIAYSRATFSLINVSWVCVSRTTPTVRWSALAWPEPTEISLRMHPVRRREVSAIPPHGRFVTVPRFSQARQREPDNKDETRLDTRLQKRTLRIGIAAFLGRPRKLYRVLRPLDRSLTSAMTLRPCEGQHRDTTFVSPDSILDRLLVIGGGRHSIRMMQRHDACECIMPALCTPYARTIIIYNVQLRSHWRRMAGDQSQLFEL